MKTYQISTPRSDEDRKVHSSLDLEFIDDSYGAMEAVDDSLFVDKLIGQGLEVK